MTSALEFIDAGRFAEALPLLQAAAEADPDNPEVHRQAGECLSRLGNHEAALGAFRHAARIRPDWPAPYLGAARAMVSQGDAHAGMQTLLHVLGFAPGHLEATRRLAELLARLKPERYLSALEPAFLQCFAQAAVDVGPLATLCGQQLRLSVTDYLQSDSPLPGQVVETLENNELWHLYLSRVINTDPFLEGFLTRLRRQIALTTTIEGGGDAPRSLIVALARQCFLNEYIFATSVDEVARLEPTARDPDENTQDPESVALAFALNCLYRAPNPDRGTLARAEALSGSCPWIADLCRLTVIEPYEEARIAEELPTLRLVHHEVSKAVQAQYEANPYPRWQMPPAPDKSPLVHYIRRQFSRRAGEAAPGGGSRILVAGCGTGFEPIDIARRDGGAAITALDLSRASLAYAKRRADSLELTNIEFIVGDILDLQETDRPFDVIVCTGVLHHMADPLQGWKILRDRLAPTGMMRIALYSARAREPVRAAREYIETRGITQDSDGIRDLRQSILRDSRHPDLAVLLHSDDFYSMSGCRDLLFHVQERHFTLPEIGSALRELDLRFCGFDPADSSILRRFTTEHPDPDALLNLDIWDRFEGRDPGIFSGMYQFWCEPDHGENK